MNRWAMLACTLLVLAGCKKTEAPVGAAVSYAPRVDVSDPFGVEHPDLTLPPKSRAVKRLTVEQLRRSLPALAGEDQQGPITWRLPFGGGIDALDEKGVGAVLGDPNYVTRVEEPRDVSPLYLKFADDMSRDVCRTLVQNEYSPNAPEQPVLTRFVDKDDLSDSGSIDANLRYLSLHFLGEYISEEDAETLAPLRALFDAAIDFEGETHERAQEGWYATCTAMMASPSFHLY